MAASSESSEESGFGTPGEFLPTLAVLVGFSVAWGTVQYRDGSLFAGLLVLPPLAVGMLSAATVRMILGRAMGGVVMVGGLGIVLFAMMFAVSTVLASRGSEQAFTFEAAHIAVMLVMGVLGSFLGSFALGHYLRREQPQEADEDVPEEEPEDDIDYTTEPEELVCLLTNQVVNRDHDRYVVCHNKMNVSQVCHAVYLFDYVHLLDGRCRRCFQQLRERDQKGMGAARAS